MFRWLKYELYGNEKNSTQTGPGGPVLPLTGSPGPVFDSNGYVTYSNKMINDIAMDGNSDFY